MFVTLPMTLFTKLSEWYSFVDSRENLTKYYEAQRAVRQAYARIFVILDEPLKGEGDEASNGVLWAEYVMLGKRIKEMEDAFEYLKGEKEWLANKGNMLEWRVEMIEKKAGKAKEKVDTKKSEWM
jgi:hypothetical protein